jgi:hypothetical protein
MYRLERSFLQNVRHSEDSRPVGFDRISCFGNMRNFAYTVRSQKKINRVSHDHHGSVGSPSLNIDVVKKKHP